MYVYRKGEPAVVQVVPVAETRPGRKLSPFDPELCGTNKGYFQYHRHGSEKCQPCRTAHTEYEKARQVRKRK